MTGIGASTGTGESVGFAEQFHDFKAAGPHAVRPAPTPAHAKVTSTKKAADGGEPSGRAEPTDNTTRAAVLAAFPFGMPGAAPSAKPMELHLTGDALPPVKSSNDSGAQAGQQPQLPEALDLQVMSTPLEAAATQIQQGPAALGEPVVPPAAAPGPITVPLPAEPSASGPETTDLTFAARLKPGPATPANQDTSPQSGVAVPRVTAITECRRTETDNGRNENAGMPPAPQTANPSTQAFMTHDGPVSLAPADKTLVPVPAEMRALTLDAAAVKSTEPLKELSLQVGNANQERVEVRMVERGGELHIAVRTGDADLAHGLREGISDLVSRLQETGFRTDTWRPVHSAAAVSATFGPQQSATEFRNHGDSQPGHGWAEQQGRDQRDQKQSSRPGWVEELEGSLTATTEPSQGDNHGLFR
jgi:hypothetical protein